MPRGRGTIIVSSLLLLTIFAVAANNLMVNDVSAATSPSLGAASSFAILGATAITNTGIGTHIIGDVGLGPAAGSNYAGLAAVQVTGTIYAVDTTGPAGSVSNPSFVGSAQADNTAAFGALSAVPNVACTHDYGAVTQDLSGLTLVPGVYCANVFQLVSSSPLILDDTGAPNGVWIFRTTAAAALTTTPGVSAKVQFLNGIGSPCNVWWKVASSATIGSGTAFIGNILALTSISVGSSSSLNGRALAQTGAVTIDTSQVSSACVLPVTLTVSGTTTTIFVTGILSVISGQTSTFVVVVTGGSTVLIPFLAFIPEFPLGVVLLLILMLPAYMLLKRRSQNSISKSRS